MQNRYHASKKWFELFIWLLPLVGFMLFACEQHQSDAPQSAPITQPTALGQRLAQLAPLPECEQLEADFKARAIEAMEASINRSMQKIRECGGCCYSYYDGDLPFPAPPGGEDGGAGEGSGASEYSTTNNQVAGVDEADFIKNDGSYIYILANNKFQIIDAWPPEIARVLSRVDIQGTPRKLFVSADRALIYSSLGPIGSTADDYDGYDDSYDECTYGYDCDFSGDNRRLKITVFDISDRRSPKLVREIRFSGSYINARRIGSAIHTVALSPVGFLDLKYEPALLERCWYGEEEKPTLEELLAAYDELKQENRARIDNATITDWLPTIADIRYSDNGTITTSNLLRNCQNFYTMSATTGESFLTLFSLDIDQLADPSHVTIFGRPGAVYASPTALYVAARQQYYSGYSWYYAPSANIQEASTVHKFNLKQNPTGCEYAGSGVVKGRVLNQFAMDEYEDSLRIATTTGHLPSSDVHSTMSILQEQAGDLVVVGQIDNIAPSEDIRAVRFSGSHGFIVTFKKTDPLFAFDLSDPTAPGIEGELKIPGFSTYIHLMDEGHLLTIGYDSDDQGDFAWFQGLLLQIFDVSDMTAPLLLHKEVIGTRGSSSEAATNHLAFNYFAPKHLLAIPITICEGGEGGYFGDLMTFSGLLVYDVNILAGFRRRGGVSHVASGSGDSWDLCGNWWTQSNSTVQRSIFMDDYVYSVALDQIKIDSLYNLGTDISVINLLE